MDDVDQETIGSRRVTKERRKSDGQKREERGRRVSRGFQKKEPLQLSPVETKGSLDIVTKEIKRTLDTSKIENVRKMSRLELNLAKKQ